MRGLAVAIGASCALVACKNVTRFSNDGDHYEGAIVQADFVRAGIDPKTSVCIVLDANHLQDQPGTLSTSDHVFASTPLRPIPQIWHDPLSTFDFGEGRVQNLLYMATPMVDGSPEADVTVVVSLMQAGNVEVRLVCGAPAPAGTPSTAMFGVFSLDRAGGPCGY